MNSEIEVYNPGVFDLTAIDRDPNLAETTKFKYKRELTRYIDAGYDLTDFSALADYASELPKSRRAFLKSALRKISKGGVEKIKAGANPQNIGAVIAVTMRLDALNGVIKIGQQKGVKIHNWLRQDEVKALMLSTEENDNELVYLRDWVILGLLLGAGLRRDELVNLRFEDITQVPNGKGERDVLQVRSGKGSKSRVIPISEKLADMVEKWRIEINADPGELIARSLGRSTELGESISAVSVFHIVRKYGRKIGKPKLAPHDLRRTFAQLGYRAGVPLTEISALLGHASVKTTQTYLDLSVDLDITASDFVPL